MPKCSKCKREYPEELVQGNGWCDHCQEDYDEWSHEMVEERAKETGEIEYEE